MTSSNSLNIILLLTVLIINLVYGTVNLIPYTHLGCYTDQETRAVSGAPSNVSKIEECADKCASKTYFAIQNGKDCRCGDSLANAIKYGKASNCKNKMGGTLSNDLYEYQWGFAQEGCYNDTVNKRALSDGPHTNNIGYTPLTCFNYCYDNDFRYFSLQNGKDCYCSNNLDDSQQYGRAKDNECKDGRGGILKNDIYRIINPKTPDPNPKKGFVCDLPSYGRKGVGLPDQCPPSNPDKDGLLCYPNCRDGYNGVGPVCWENCKQDYTDDGAFCRRPLVTVPKGNSYDRGIGVLPANIITKVCPSSHPDYDAGLCYKACRQGYSGVATLCYPNCPEGSKDVGLLCELQSLDIYAKKSYGRGAGVPLNCPDGLENDGGVCYEPCKPGYNGVAFVCWLSAFWDNFISNGVNDYIQCAEPIMKLVFDNPTDWTNENYVEDTMNRNLKLKKDVDDCKERIGKQETVLGLEWSVSAAVGVEGSAAIGLVFDKTGTYFYTSVCLGFITDISVGVDMHIILHKSLDDVSGPGNYLSLGFDIPVANLGVGIGISMNPEAQCELVGISASIGIGFGLSPVTFSFGYCEASDLIKIDGSNTKEPMQTTKVPMQTTMAQTTKGPMQTTMTRTTKGPMQTMAKTTKTMTVTKTNETVNPTQTQSMTMTKTTQTQTQTQPGITQPGANNVSRNNVVFNFLFLLIIFVIFL